jgi:hypothetical protein
MALDGTATGLRASIADWLHRSDLTSQIPDFIAMAEAQMNRRLLVRRQLTRLTVTISAETLALPSDFSHVRSFRITDDPMPHLKFVSIEKMAELKDNDTYSTCPQVYTVTGGEFEFYPVPGASYAAKLVYYNNLPPLASNASNWLLTSHPDAYLYGSLVQAAPYLRDDERLAVWGQLFTTVLDDINSQSVAEGMGGDLSPGGQGLVI